MYLLSKNLLDHDSFRPFLETTEKNLDEVEMYLAHANALTDDDCLDSIRRRYLEIRTGGRSLSLGPMEALCLAAAERIETLRDTEARALSIETEPLYEAHRMLQHDLQCLRMQADGDVFPPSFDAFALRRHDFLQERLRLCNQNQAGAVDKEPPLCILVTDDETMVREMLSDLLENNGHHVLAVPDGEQALLALRSGMFDLMFTDINMPKMDGIQLLRQAKTYGLDTEIVIITGYATLENAAEAVRLGAYDYFTKPFENTTDILGTVRRAREHLSLVRRNRQLMLDLRYRNEELKRYADGLRDALALAEEKQQALIHADRMASIGALAAGVAHEINNPTTFIRGNVQTMERFWETIRPLVQAQGGAEERIRFILDEMPGLLHDMLAGTERITRIVSALRSFSHQGEKGTRKAVTVGSCVAQALELVHNRIKDVVEVINALPDDLPLLQADPQQLTQVFVNLFVNAADAMDAVASPRLMIRGNADEGHLVVEVEDNGHGVTEDIRSRIFDPFFTTKPVDKGTGLGLSILLGIVREHGGSVAVDTPQSGVGTIFRLRFSLETDTLSPPPEPRILIVEDAGDYAALLQRVLRASGPYVTDVAANGTEALKMLEGGMPDLIVLDLMLPGMDGFELLRRLRQLPGGDDVPVLVMTGLNLPNVRSRLFEMNVCDVLAKPFPFQRLVDAVGLALGARHVHRAVHP